MTACTYSKRNYDFNPSDNLLRHPALDRYDRLSSPDAPRSQQVRFQHIGLANPPERYSQREVIDRLGITDPRLKQFFLHDHIQYRHLYLPPKSADSKTPNESFAALQNKFVSGAVEMTARALASCLQKSSLAPKDIDFICCVTSTGFIVPTLSALFIKQFGLRTDCQRVDVVGMGCNAGLNGLNAVSNWALANPNKNALLVCVEVCSAIYAVDHLLRTAVVNSLFGDGAAVVLVKGGQSEEGAPSAMPKILGFESHLIPEHLDALRFDWDVAKGRYSFYVGRETPHAIAVVADQPLQRLLRRFNVRREHVKHWILHGGGHTVLSGIQAQFGLNDTDLQHTRSVLRDFGNLSSGSFLFSFQRLVETDAARPGDLGVIMTMGPGLTIEMALAEW